MPSTAGAPAKTAVPPAAGAPAKTALPSAAGAPAKTAVPPTAGAPAKTALPPAAGTPAHKPRICVNLAGVAFDPQLACSLSPVLFAAAAVPTSDAASC